MIAPGVRRAVWIVLALACLAAAAYGASRVFTHGSDGLALGDVRWSYALLSLLATLAFVVMYAGCWALLVSALERPRGRGHIALLPLMRLFLLTWPGRYVPASLPHYGGRLVAAPRLGVSRSAVAASLVYENVFAIAGAGLLSAALLLVAYRENLGGSAWLLAAVAAAPLALAALHPAVARTAIRVASRRVRRLHALEDHILTPAAIVRIGALYVCASVFAGLAFWCALRAVDASAPLPLALAAYNIAGVAGMLAIAVPSGVGVREGVVVAVIGAVVSPEVALAAAVLARLAGVVADFTPFALILAVDGVSRLRRRAANAAPARAASKSRAA